MIYKGHPGDVQSALLALTNSHFFGRIKSRVTVMAALNLRKGRHKQRHYFPQNGFKYYFWGQGNLTTTCFLFFPEHRGVLYMAACTLRWQS